MEGNVQCLLKAIFWMRSENLSDVFLQSAWNANLLMEYLFASSALMGGLLNRFTASHAKIISVRFVTLMIFQFVNIVWMDIFLTLMALVNLVRKATALNVVRILYALSVIQTSPKGTQLNALNV